MAIIDKPTDHFNTALYTGNGTTQSITSLDFQPDLTWIKGRSDVIAHVLFDSVRGAGGNKEIGSNVTYAEGGNSSISYGFLSSFNSDGFTVRNGTSSPNQADYTNKNSSTYASWNWKAGTAVSGATTGAGTAKTYTGSVNTTSGFSIINFVGNGTAGHTIPHHLGVAPKMVIVKNITSASTYWQTYHYNLDNGAGTNEIFLDLTNATNVSGGAWNSTAPTSTVITKGAGSYGNQNDSNHIMYCFANTSMIKCGSYTGNGSTDGTFVYTGFKPAFVLMKRSDSAENWDMLDNKRNTFNASDKLLKPNLSNAEGTFSTIDMLSNGFKQRNSDAEFNASGGTYIYLAIAEQPFVTSTTNGSIPATAR